MWPTRKTALLTAFGPLLRWAHDALRQLPSPSPRARLPAHFARRGLHTTRINGFVSRASSRTTSDSCSCPAAIPSRSEFLRGPATSRRRGNTTLAGWTESWIGWRKRAAAWPWQRRAVQSLPGWRRSTRKSVASIQVIDFMLWEMAAIRKNSEAPCTTNLMGTVAVRLDLDSAGGRGSPREHRVSRRAAGPSRSSCSCKTSPARRGRSACARTATWICWPLRRRQRPFGSCRGVLRCSRDREAEPHRRHLTGNGAQVDHYSGKTE